MPVSNMFTYRVEGGRPSGSPRRRARGTAAVAGPGPPPADGEQHRAERARRVPRGLCGADELPSGLGHACLLGWSSWTIKQSGDRVAVDTRLAPTGSAAVVVDGLAVVAVGVSTKALEKPGR